MINIHDILHGHIESTLTTGRIDGDYKLSRSISIVLENELLKDKINIDIQDLIDIQFGEDYISYIFSYIDEEKSIMWHERNEPQAYLQIDLLNGEYEVGIE